MGTGDLKYVLRELGPVGREFYRRLGRGELATTYCGACEELRFPPRERCPSCGGAQTWRSLSSRGRLYAFTQQEQGLRFLKPDVIGVVELEEGVRVFGKVEAPLERLEIGQPVEVGFLEDEAGVTLLTFRLA